MAAASTGLIFGIHPFGVSGTADSVATGPPDNIQRLPEIIEHLRGGHQILLRTYVPYAGSASVEGIFAQLEFCRISGMAWDIALCFRDRSGDLEGWLQVIREIVGRHGKTLHTLQITNEPNLTHVPNAGDGSLGNVRQALVQGVIAARQAATATGATVNVGCNAVPTFQPNDDFWPSLPKMDRSFCEALDYVGLDFYPDVFGAPIELENIPAAVERILRDFRGKDLAAAGIATRVPMRICENGWPTGPRRSHQRQAQVLASVVRAVHHLRGELNITHYELFGLRDADSSNDNLFFQFGIMRDDYTPKPAFEMYREIIGELGC